MLSFLMTTQRISQDLGENFFNRLSFHRHTGRHRCRRAGKPVVDTGSVPRRDTSTRHTRAWPTPMPKLIHDHSHVVIRQEAIPILHLDRSSAEDFRRTTYRVPDASAPGCPQMRLDAPLTAYCRSLIRMGVGREYRVKRSISRSTGNQYGRRWTPRHQSLGRS